MTAKAKVMRRGTKVTRIRAGSTEVSIYEGKVREQPRFTVAFYRGGLRVRRTFGSLDSAKMEARRVAAQLQNGFHEAASLHTTDLVACRTAMELLAPLRVPLAAAVEEYVRCRSLLQNAPLLPAVSEYVRRNQGLRLGATVPQVVGEFLAAKEQDGARPRYLDSLRCGLNRFASDISGPIVEVKSQHIDRWLRGMGTAARTRNTLLKRVRTLFSFAKSRNYLSKSEPTEAESVERVREADTETEIFAPETMKVLLAHADEDLIPYLAIGSFAGLRVAEIERLKWEAVDLERGHIELRAGQAKTASRRIVPVAENLKAWLAPFVAQGPMVKLKQTGQKVGALARKLGIRWPHNAMRHSYISYRLALVKSADQVALEAGNSPAMIFKHYRELTTEDVAKEWFGIFPKDAQERGASSPAH